MELAALAGVSSETQVRSNFSTLFRARKVGILFDRIARVFGASTTNIPWDNQEAIREELFSVERLETHARSLAKAQLISDHTTRPQPLASRLKDNGAALLAAYMAISKAADNGHAITPAAEWLIDNYHLVEKQFREVRSDLPRGYYKQLPKLADGPFAGYPRVLGIAWAFVAHTDSRFDAGILCRFVMAYQEIAPLTIGELWAISITLRIVLVENLRRIADRVVKSRTDRDAANHLADALLLEGGNTAESGQRILAGADNLPVSNAFAVQMLQRLHDQDPRVAPTMAWLERRLASRGSTPDQVVTDEHQRQGAATVTISNIINSLRMITSVDWADIFESISSVDKALAAEPTFPSLDFATRNMYRSAIEELARGSEHTELEITRLAFESANQQSLHVSPVIDCVRRGPEFALVGGGRRDFEDFIGFHPTLGGCLKWGMRTIGIEGYVIAIALVTTVFLTVALFAVSGGVLPWASLAALALLATVPITDSAVAVVNCIVVRVARPAILPGLELKAGIPGSLRTVVAVPTLLTSLQAVTEHVETLEVHYLSSPDGELYFALLSDWADASAEEMPGDAELLAAAEVAIARLNERYPAGSEGKRFHLLHRARRWSPSEGRWMGWERKRGKLHELNRLLRGATDTGFMPLSGKAANMPASIRYVIALDADTKLPRETVRKLIGKMAHPLNAPYFDARVGRVVKGYGVLQPRVTPSLPVGEAGSLFQRTFSTESGIDPYAAAVSDVYQDLFDEGSFAGKGIYDVDVFERSLEGRVPDSTLLSHDLFEGVFARAGLASDVEVIEEFPARYDISAMRQHRWTRGDWQLLPWLLGAMPAPVGELARAAIPAVGRWKMIDNLRRSLSAPLAVAALVAGWLLPFHAAWIWTLLILATVVTPLIVPVVCGLAPPRAGVPWLAHLRSVGADLSFALTQSLFVVVLLADQAWTMSDAILRTLFRLYRSRENLLEWVSHAQTASGSKPTLSRFAERMRGGIAIGLATGALPLFQHGANWVLTSPFAMLWISSPAIAYWASLPPTVAGRPFSAIWRLFPWIGHWASLSPLVEGQLPITELEAQALRLTARRTWRFFETFVSPSDNMLPPDNFQEDPVPAIAHRTSPTNIGLYLLSIVSARDFGWIGTSETVERLEAIFATLQKMERVRGHFYNWYDTQTLQPLEPKYISSVDSGNMAGHLIALSRACAEWAGTATPSRLPASGTADAVALAANELLRLHPVGAGRPEIANQFEQSFSHFAKSLHVETIPESTDDCLLAQRLNDAIAMTDLVRSLSANATSSASGDLVYWADAAKRTLQSHLRDGCPVEPRNAALADRLHAIANAAMAMATAMQFGFLLDKRRGLLSIGYRVHEDELDPSCYDLMASEARLASFVAIAKGDAPTRHWFRLGRAVVLITHRAALISWSGSMFEYLMPSLVMRAPTGSLIEQTSRLIVRRQIDYGRSLERPWGISESAYNVRDLEFTYQYSNFGVPGLGLKRGLDANIVIAPYATALASMVDPQAAVLNYEALRRAGGLGRYGFYEALDYTQARLPKGETVAVVRAFMAHHQGMTIVAIANTLQNAAMRRRFHAEPFVQAAELLLQERPPRDVAETGLSAVLATSVARSLSFEAFEGRRFTAADAPSPATHLLSNGQYAVMLTTAGSGYSRCRDIAITRWREDATCDDWGSYLYLRDEGTGAVWSAGFQPTGTPADDSEIIFTEDRAVFTRRDGLLTTTLDVLVSSEDNAEVRHVSVVNNGLQPRIIEFTSYAELALATQGADQAHQAFSKLSVQTEYLPDVEAIIATRRRRSPSEPETWLAHLAVIQGDTVGGIEIETDRARFLGRNGSVRRPSAVASGSSLTNTIGTVLDAVFVLRRKLRIAPGGMARVAFWTMVAPTRPALMDSIDKHRDDAAFERAATLAWTQGQVQLHHIGIDPGIAALFQRLAGHLLFAGPEMRASSQAIQRGAGGQPGLWPLSISGDLPILLLRIADQEHLDIAHQLLLAHEYWRLKNFSIDLVILNERGASYVQDLQIAIETMVRTNQSRRRASDADANGNVFVVRGDLMTAETRALLVSVARLVLTGQRGTLAEQLDRMPVADVRMPAKSVLPGAWAPVAPANIPELEFFNGLGGFSDNGREYVVVMAPGQTTPAPWINVIANPGFGFQTAAEGSGFTWSVISRENQLTPWSNDPIGDRPGEAIYLRDEDSGEIWSATASPIRDEATTYVTHHGRGYTRFEHGSHGVAVDLVQFVPASDPVKISLLSLRNLSNRARRLSVTFYAEWVLGASRTASSAYVTTALDEATGALLARNRWAPAFASRIAFCDMGGQQTQWTADRREFIGRNGTLSAPAALTGSSQLSGRVGAGLDPCGAMRTTITIAAGQTVEVRILLGQTASVEETQALVGKYRSANLDAVLAEVTQNWQQMLQTVQVTTPDRAMDIMLNGWLLYQTLACRVWARSALYQASGAYGFRDQLQDGMALVAIRPDLTRAHLVLAAGRQFVEGDVQHWWFPNTGQGTRSRITDDRAWLAYCALHYIEASGDGKILDEEIAFLDGQWLHPGEHDSLFQPTISDAKASFYEHCALALDQSLGLGVHGLPLMGTGDWNDGMNRVGEHGTGESIWLAWLHYTTLTSFAAVAEARGEPGRAAKWRNHARALAVSLEAEGWDGEWYRRGYYDDGTPLGSALNEECRIDSLTQSWAVMSGAGDLDRARQAMAAVERELIVQDEQIALLFKPPFDKTALDPGYIKGYPPGLRENGGQYTHAALWSVIAFAMLGEGEKSANLFALLNPINHARTPHEVSRYVVEPYVVAADVYAEPPHVGRGGWSWYTGSAGWMQRAGMEYILGLRVLAGVLHLDPCIPKAWPRFSISLRHGSARYDITVENPKSVSSGITDAVVDTVNITTRPFAFALADDGTTHHVNITLG